MSATILKEAPISGEYPEVHFGEHFKDILWVKFEDNDYNEWVGCFEKPYSNFDKVLVNSKNESVFVATGGHGYLIDINSRLLLYNFDEWDGIESLIYSINHDYFVVGTFYKINIFDCKSLIKEFQPDLTVDGIYFTEIKGTKAIGDIYSYIYGGLNVGFELDLDTFELKINGDIKVKRKNAYEYERIE